MVLSNVSLEALNAYQMNGRSLASGKSEFVLRRPTVFQVRNMADFCGIQCDSSLEGIYAFLRENKSDDCDQLVLHESLGLLGRPDDQVHVQKAYQQICFK